MKQENIKNTQSFNQTAKPLDEAAQKRRRKDAYQSTITSSVIFLITGIMLLVLRGYYHIDGFWGTIMLIIAVLELGMLIPIWILLKTRLKEIEGGEEDAATQY